MLMPSLQDEKRKLDQDPLADKDGERKDGDRQGQDPKDGLKGKSYDQQVKSVSPSGAKGDPAEVQRAQQGLSGKGEALPHKATLEARFGQSLDDVVAHTGPEARDAALAVGANAYAIGNQVVFSKANPDLETVAHEVTHVLQQTRGDGKTAESDGKLEGEAKAGAGPEATGQGPVALMKDVTKLLDKAKVARAVQYNRGRAYTPDMWKAIQQKVETAPTGVLNEETVLAIAQWQKDAGLDIDGMVGPATLRKLDVHPPQEQAQQPQQQEQQGDGTQSQTFGEDAVGDMKDFFVDNATGANPLPCITAMNKGLNKLYGKKLKTGSTVQDTMAEMQKAGLVSSKKVIEFLDDRGKITTGVREPMELSESPSAWLIDQCKAEPGLHVFGMSMMDGYHSITITVDTRDPSAPKIYWSDQWSSHGGFKPFSAGEFDEKIKNHTNSWWNSYKSQKGHPPRSRLTFWKLQAAA